MSVLALILIVAAVWVGLVLAARLVLLPMVRRAPGNDPIIGVLWYLVRVYCRHFHRARYRGQEELRGRTDPGGLIVVSNHTSGVDPLLIQAACRFHIRWMMAADMMNPELDWLWTRQNIIPVSRDGRDTNAAREAIRHVRSGGVLGIFPEGRIVTHGEIRPFHIGAGLIAARTGAPILLVWISGTPQTESLSASFTTPSRAQVIFAELVHFDSRDPKEITEHLRSKLSKLSGWPINDEPMPMLRIAERVAPRERDSIEAECAAGTAAMRLTA
jgi:1-acyl-sn-glycerol-3-phosphate acyltransferase